MDKLAMLLLFGCAYLSQWASVFSRRNVGAYDYAIRSCSGRLKDCFKEGCLAAWRAQYKKGNNWL